MEFEETPVSKFTVGTRPHRPRMSETSARLAPAKLATAKRCGDADCDSSSGVKTNCSGSATVPRCYAIA